MEPALSLPPSAQRQPFHLPSALQLTLSTLGIAFLWISAFSLAFVGLVSVVFIQERTSDTLSMLLLAATLVFSGLLLLPSAYYALRRLQGKPAVDTFAILRKTRPAQWILVLPLVLLAGHLVYKTPPVNWLILPILHIAAIGLPIGWILYLALRGLPLGSAQRLWGAFDSGLVLAPLIISILEGLAALGFVLIGAIYLAQNPDLVQKLFTMAQWIQINDPTPEQILQRYSPQLLRPEIVWIALLFAALVVPLIEEIFKPIGAWLLAGRRLTPAAGFAAGALSGAGYALFESLLLTSSGEEWAALMVARIGTALVHIFTAAITGWAITYSLRSGNYLKLGMAYLSAVLLHAIWNGITVLTSFTTLAAYNNLPLNMPAIAQEMGKLAPFILVSLAAATFLMLVLSNRVLAQSLPAQQPAAITGSTEAESPKQANQSVL